MIGSKLGPYDITAKLGEGGMGEVYRATDTKLKRDVAIKVLPAAFTEDKERLARFEREAQLLAQLHHPNIASIFGLEESGGTKALIMELVEGPTLAERLEQGPLPFTECLSVSLQIAQALEEAHEKGIVHRDLKPQNVKASIEGKVKVLDFGLAKAMDPTGAISGPGSASHLAKSPTLTMGATVQGMILGTAAYMAPEQAKGMAVDKRADIWAFGVVLYEMLVGGSLFAGDSVGDTLAAVIRAEIDLGRLPPETPAAIRRLLRRCLERNPRNRLHDIADARIVLEEVSAGKSEEPERGASAVASAPVVSRGRWPFLAGGLAAGLLIGVAVAGLWTGRPAGAHRGAVLSQFSIQPPEGTGYVRGLALSPDGRRIAFVARGANGRVSLWVRSLDALAARQLPETDDARYPFWAPDGRRIGFFSQRNLKWTDSEGGTPLVVTSTSSVQDVRGAAWSADDTIVFSPNFMGPLLAVQVSGGASRPASQLPESGEIGTHRFPSFLPDGRRFVFYASASTGTEPGSLHLGRLGTLDAKLLGPAHSSAVFATPGYLVYARGESLVAHAFDSRREELVGDPVPIGVPIGGSLSVSGLRSVSAAANGALVYRSDKRNASQLVMVDRSGRELQPLSDSTSTWFYAPRLSPDGRFLLASQYKGQGNLGEIWVHDIARKLATRLTLDGGDAYMPLWLRPGSRELLYNSARPKNPGGIYRAALDRPGEELLWLNGETAQSPGASTPDGRRIVFERADEKGRVGLWIRDLEGESTATRLSPSTAIEMSADISPDGQWLAYTSDTTRNWEVYIRHLDGSGGVIRISSDGGFQPLWRRDGRELLYVDSNGRLVAVPIASGVEPGSAEVRLRPGAPEVLFEARLEESTDRQYDATADGQRFILNRSVANDGVPIVVVLDWTALLERRAP